MAAIDAVVRESNTSVPSWISITVKSSKERKDIVIEDNKTVAQLRTLVAKELGMKKEQLCLIFRSATLEDASTLRQCAVVDGSVVHVYVKTAITSPEGEFLQNQPTTKTGIEATPFGLVSVGGIQGLVDLGFGSANFADMQQKMQRELYSNPELMQSLLDNPIVKDIMSKPTMYKQLVASNPFMADMLKDNPVMAEVLENPDLMKQMMSLARQPALLQELIDPKYRDFIGSRGSKEDCSTAQPSSNSNTESKETTKGDESNGGFLDKGTESIMRQMIEQPRNMVNILQAPYVQSAINYTASNPEYLRMMMNHMPGLKNTEAEKKHLDLSLPYFSQQLVNPEVQSLMCNPRALQAIMDIQEGMRELQEDLPGFFGYQTSSSADDTKPSFVSQVVSSVVQSDLPDEEKYAIQLRQLQLMGFTDHEENLRVLGHVGGDINSVIIHHLQQQHQYQQAEEYQPTGDEESEMHQQDQLESLQLEGHIPEQQDENMEDQLLLGDHAEGQQHLDEQGGESKEDDSDQLLGEELDGEPESLYDQSEDMQAEQ